MAVPGWPAAGPLPAALPAGMGGAFSPLSSLPGQPVGGGAIPVPAAAAEAPPQSLEDVEIQTIRQVLDAAGGNISVAAKRLGISRNTIYRKLRWNGSR